VNSREVSQACSGHPANVRVHRGGQAQAVLLHPPPVGVVQRHAHQGLAERVGITLTEGGIGELPINRVGFLVAEGFGQPSLLLLSLSQVYRQGVRGQRASLTSMPPQSNKP
jgi:hypothetical protein